MAGDQDEARALAPVAWRPVARALNGCLTVFAPAPPQRPGEPSHALRTLAWTAEEGRVSRFGLPETRVVKGREPAECRAIPTLRAAR